MDSDFERLQGSWTVKDLEMDGQEMPAGMLADARIVVKGVRFTSAGMGAVYDGVVELDASKTPKHVNMRFDAGPEKGNINRGIYHLDGDIWKICLATRGGERPSGFASPPDSGIALETLAREGAGAVGKRTVKTKARPSKATVPADVGTGPKTEFEGEWSMVSGIMEGKPMDESHVQWVRRVTEGNEATVYAGPQVMLRVEFTSDPSTSPKSINYLNLAGRNRGKTQYGIYEFKGKLLRICVAGPGEERPAEFESRRSDRSTLTVWKKG
jgi:uncharacterized protein (TIGR03067 family)